MRALAVTLATAIPLPCGCLGDDLPPALPELVCPDGDADDLFGPNQIVPISLELDDDALAALEREPYRYVEGTFRCGEVELHRVGVRLKGMFSFQDLDGKAAFKIKFDEFVPGQTFRGLERLTLNNMRQDRSQVHEALAYMVFRAVGVPAPRSGYAWVEVNGEPYGLYANVESVDRVFLEKRYRDPSGPFYEAPWGADLIPESLSKFELDAGDEGPGRPELAALIEQANLPGDEVFFGDGALLDTAELLAFMAAEAATGHWDGYWKANNYRIYFEPAAGTWTFLPWGTDQTFDRDLAPFSGAGFLMKKCVASERCLVEYARAGLDVADRLELLPLPEQLDELAALIADAVAADPRSPHPPEKVWRHMEMTRARIAATPNRLRAQYDCLEGEAEADRDGDGFGACLSDCDDYSPVSHPGAAEVCDGADNDCDGLVDELADCPCEGGEAAGADLLFCTGAVPWIRARDLCIARGGSLAVPRDESEAEAMQERAASLAPGPWFIGANDLAEEGQWTDPAGAELDFARWAAGEPDDFGDQDCGVLAPFGEGGWADERCAPAHPYVCRVGEAP